MDRTQDDPSHRAVVDTWIRQVIDQAEPDQVMDLFRVAFEAIWGRAVTTLGSVTVIAIAERVLATATREHSFLTVINLRPNGDARWKQQLRERLALVPRPDLVAGMRFAFIELLAVMGRLTAEILSSELHAALVSVTAASVDTASPAELRVVPSSVNGKAQV